MSVSAMQLPLRAIGFTHLVPAVSRPNGMTAPALPQAPLCLSMKSAHAIVAKMRDIALARNRKAEQAQQVPVTPCLYDPGVCGRARLWRVDRKPGMFPRDPPPTHAPGAAVAFRSSRHQLSYASPWLPLPILL